MRILVAALLVLAAGCAQAPSDADPTGEASMPADESSSGEPAGSADPSDPGTPASAPAPLGLQTWYPHVVRTCGEDPLCNCGSNRLFIDQTDIPEECDGHGRRSALPNPFDGPCEPLCFPNDEPMPAYPVGSHVEGTIYLTNDGVGEATLTLRLLAQDVEVGAVTTSPTLIVGLGGYAWQAVPFAFDLVADIPVGVPVQFEIHADATESWFVGYDGDHTSSFTIAPPA